MPTLDGEITVTICVKDAGEEYQQDIELTATLEFEAFCDKCGTGLCANVYGTRGRTRNFPQIRIIPCECCLKDAEEIGKSEGYSEAVADLGVD